MGTGNHNDDVEGYLQANTYRPKYNPFPLVPPFKEGDHVYLRSGHAPQVVLEVKPAPRNIAACGYVMRCAYTRWFDAADAVSKRWRTCDDYALYDGDPAHHDYTQGRQAGTKKEDLVPKLYQTIEEKPRFGTFLAKNSTGQLVLEMKDGGPANIQAFDPEQIEEVKPYTVAIDFNGSLANLEAVKGSLNEGDIVVSNHGMIGIVRKINTGHSNPSGRFQGRRVVTEPVGE